MSEHSSKGRDNRPQRAGRPAKYSARGGDAGSRQVRRVEEPRHVPPPGLARRADEPPVPEGLDEGLLPRAARAELRSLTKELADAVTAYLIAAGQLIDTDPELAYRHAEAARRRASRLPIVREATAETAYAAGEYAVALNEYRALRRMNGGDEYYAVIADCERALGRPGAALEIIKDADKRSLEPNVWAEVRLVEAGVRQDLGQGAEAKRILKNALARGQLAPESVVRLRYAYAEAHLADQPQVAVEWFRSAAKVDTAGWTDADERADELCGMRLEIAEDEVSESEAVDG